MARRRAGSSCWRGKVSGFWREGYGGFKSWTLPVAVAIVVVYRCLLVFCRAGAVHAAQGLDLDIRGVRAEAAEVGG